MLVSLASCENQTEHKHKEICCVWPIKELVPDSLHLSNLNKMADAVVDFDAYVDVRFQAAYACACACVASENQG